MPEKPIRGDYASPRQPAYLGQTFARANGQWRPRILALLASRPRFLITTDDEWALYQPASPQPRLHWQPKVYLCLGPRDYWATVAELVTAFDSWKHPWKFHLGVSGLDRPDKIVFYFPDARALRLALTRLRRFLGGRTFHDLHQAASTSDLGLERPGARGLYVGADPVFLRTSWRLYRCLCEAWARNNAPLLQRLPGGLTRWYSRMNLSSHHEGPASLGPFSPAELRYMRRHWKRIWDSCSPERRVPRR
jgi:hypothetical protein